MSSINDNKLLKYYLLYNNKTCIGISGFYMTHEDIDSGWLLPVVVPYGRFHRLQKGDAVVLRTE